MNLLPSQFSYFQLGRIEVDGLSSIKIQLVNPLNEEYYELRFDDIAFYSFAKSPGDDGGCYLIGKIIVLNHKITRNELIEKGVKLIDGSMLSCMYEFSLEGDVCMDIISKKAFLDNKLMTK